MVLQAPMHDVFCRYRCMICSADTEYGFGCVGLDFGYVVYGIQMRLYRVRS